MNSHKYANRTPGPWEVASGSPYRVMWTERDSNGEVTDCRVIVDTATNPKTRTPENAANARLIAAAPAMLEALEETLSQLRTVTSTWTDDDLNNLIIRRAEAAIRQAKGLGLGNVLAKGE